MGQDLADRPWFRDERDQPDVAAAGWALERKLLPQPRHQLGPRNPGGVMRTGLLIRVAAASGAVTVAPMPTGRGPCRLPTFLIASEVTARLSLWLGANTP